MMRTPSIYAQVLVSWALLLQIAGAEAEECWPDERARLELDFELPYDTVLGVFHGDWYAAADIYKEWALKQHWCTKKVFERTDLPEWLKEPRFWPAIISRGNYARLGGGLSFPPAEYPIEQYWPASKVVSDRTGLGLFLSSTTYTMSLLSLMGEMT